MNPKKNIGLFFGSFNPVHIGHLIIASHIINHYAFDQIWFVISPQNPLKEKKTLLPDYHRLALVNLAIEHEPKFKACDIEFKLAQPSYTVTTLAHLHEKYPAYSFSLIMGSDTLNTLTKWKNYNYILENYPLFIYPRKDDETLSITHQNIVLTQAPIIEISASEIRRLLKVNKISRFYLTDAVYNYIQEMHFYEK